MVDASCGGTFMLKSEEEAWQLFETLSENSLHRMSATTRESPMLTQKRGGMYEIGSIMDIHSKVDALSQKIDHILETRHTLLIHPTPPKKYVHYVQV